MYGAFADPVRTACHSTAPAGSSMIGTIDSVTKSEVKVS